MKAALVLTLLTSIASAAPLAELAVLESRQPFDDAGFTANEFTTGGCKPIIFIFARGSTEPGNMGFICGPPTADKLKEEFGASNVAVEGVDYPASLMTNLLPSGGDPEGVRNMQQKLHSAAQCEDSIIIAGGYRFVDSSH